MLNKNSIKPLIPTIPYLVTAVQMVENYNLEVDDLGVAGEYTIHAISGEDALDRFHSIIPITSLEDFRVLVEEI